MTVYKVTRKIEEFEVDEKELLNRIKRCDCDNDKDIQNANSMKELIKLFGSLNDFDAEVEDFCKEGEIVINSVLYEDNWEEAYDIIEWGIH